jgi:hypothetical protein
MSNDAERRVIFRELMHLLVLRLPTTAVFGLVFYIFADGPVRREVTFVTVAMMLSFQLGQTVRGMLESKALAAQQPDAQILTNGQR